VLEPAHLVVALSEGQGSCARLLRVPNVPRALRTAAFGELGPMGNGARSDWRSITLMSSAEQWAAAAGREATTAHLLIAIAEQADPDVIAACHAAGVDLGRARTGALNELGWNGERIPALQCPIPAGTMDRPPLPIDELPVGAWADLQDRLPRLPFARIRHTWQWGTLRGIEGDAAWRVADRHHVSDDARYSLSHHHSDAVDRRGAEAIPDVVSLARSEYEDEYELMFSRPFGEYITLRLGSRTHRMASPLPGGWLTWFGNRRAGIRYKWHRLRFRVTCRY